MKRILMTAIWAAVFFLGVVSVSDAWWGKKAKGTPEGAADVKEAVQAEAPAPAKAEKAQVAEAPEAKAPVEPVEEVKEEEKPAPSPPPSVDRKEMDKKRAMKDKRRKAVDGNQWEISVISMTGKGEKTPDALVFAENKFSSQEYEKKGYAPSNYTVSITDEGKTVVETMQSDEEMGILFWRVEFDEDLAGCRGVISRQISENKTDDYSFVSTAKKPVVK